jgi:hypothetical protein
MTPFAQLGTFDKSASKSQPSVLRKSASEPLTLGLRPLKPSHGAVAGGLGGAVTGGGAGGILGGVVGAGRALLDDEDDGLKSALKKILRDALIGSAVGVGVGGVAGAGSGAVISQLAREDVRANFKKEHPVRSRLPGASGKLETGMDSQIIPLRDLILGLSGRKQDDNVIL